MTTADRIASWIASTGADRLRILVPRSIARGPNTALCRVRLYGRVRRISALSRSSARSSVAYRLFSDDVTVEGWEPRRFDEASNDPVRTAKKPKILPHLYFEDSDWSIWTDANITLRSDPRELVAEVERSGLLIGVFPHPERGCAYDEAMRCVSGAKDDADIILEADRPLQA